MSGIYPSFSIILSQYECLDFSTRLSTFTKIVDCVRSLMIHVQNLSFPAQTRKNAEQITSFIHPNPANASKRFPEKITKKMKRSRLIYSGNWSLIAKGYHPPIAKVDSVSTTGPILSPHYLWDPNVGHGNVPLKTLSR